MLALTNGNDIRRYVTDDDGAPLDLVSFNLNDPTQATVLIEALRRTIDAYHCARHERKA
jgi:hypothetical protein